jgi:hypothetical protein
MTSAMLARGAVSSQAPSIQRPGPRHAGPGEKIHQGSRPSLISMRQRLPSRDRRSRSWHAPARERRRRRCAEFQCRGRLAEQEMIAIVDHLISAGS